MKLLSIVLSLPLVFSGFALAQSPLSAPDSNVPALTLEEKISLVTDDLKRNDELEKANKAFLLAILPIQSHQEATKALIEKEHPGWTLEGGSQGWHLVKKVEPKPAEPLKPETKPTKPTETPKK